MVLTYDGHHSTSRLDLRKPAVAALAALATVAALSAVPTVVAAAGGSSAPPGASDAVHFETIQGTKLKRVILSAKAVERLGIETTEVSEESIIQKQMLGGQVVPSSNVDASRQRQEVLGAFGGFGQLSDKPTLQPVATAVPPTSGPDAWIRLAVSQDEWDRIAQDVPARVLPMVPGAAADLVAEPSGLPPFADIKRSMLTVYYVVRGDGHGLKLNDRARVEVALKGSGEKRMIVPYSAIYYDDEGITWVYVNGAPRTYERQRVDVARIEGSKAILNQGPPVGTRVVSTGAPLLYGAEVVYKY